MDDNNQPKKPIFLYVVIIVLVIALAGLGALSFFSLSHLASLQKKVQTLSDTVTEISDSANTLISQADQLDQLKEQEKQQQTTENEGSGSNESSAVNESFTDNSDSSMDSLLSQVKTLRPQDNGTWSVYVCNLLKDSNGVINNTPMQAASLIKLYIMGAVYDNYDAISQSHGGDTVDSNISSMITVSDNDAANTLVNWLGNGDNSAGMQKVNEFCQKYGFNDTQMNRLLLADNSNGDNYTSAKDCGIFLKKIYQISKGIIDSSSLPNAEAMYYHLKMQQRKNKIPADLPEGVQTANKTGELDTVENDAAIIYDTAKGIDLVICFMSQDLTDTQAAQSTIAADARAIYGYYNE